MTRLAICTTQRRSGRYLATLLCLACSLPLVATAATNKAEKLDNVGLSTNVVGSNEAPTVLNIVPWQDQAITIKPQAPTSHLLDQVLQPLDVQVLNREIDYYRMLNQKNDDSGLFLN